jgi:hypothetical protein
LIVGLTPLTSTSHVCRGTAHGGHRRRGGRRTGHTDEADFQSWPDATPFPRGRPDLNRGGLVIGRRATPRKGSSAATSQERSCVYSALTSPRTSPLRPLAISISTTHAIVDYWLNDRNQRQIILQQCAASHRSPKRPFHFMFIVVLEDGVSLWFPPQATATTPMGEVFPTGAADLSARPACSAHSLLILGNSVYFYRRHHALPSFQPKRERSAPYLIRYRSVASWVRPRESSNPVPWE